MSKKIYYFLSHPIQYQSPLIKYLTKKKMNIMVLYKNKLNSNFYDTGFARKINFGLNLLSGYKYTFLKYGNLNLFQIHKSIQEITNILKDKNTGLIWLHGNKNFYNLLIIFLNIFYKKKIATRDECWSHSKNRTMVNLIFNKIFYFILNRFVDFFFVIGKANQKYYERHKIPKKKLVKINYVVDNNFFYSKKRKKNIIKFLYVGKINFITKGVNTLLKAIKNIKLNEHNKKKIYFKIVGNGKDFEKTKNFLFKHKLKNVKLTNFKNQHELKRIYRSSDVLVVPSNLEPWGLVVNEAMSAGNAIICSDKVGSRFDLVKNNYNGLIFRSKDYLSLLKKLNFFIYNKNLLIKFQHRSQKIISNYNFDRIYKTLNNLMLKI